MAKQIGDIRITGTVAGVTFYKMEGQYYARKKSSLTGKRVKTDPKFRRTMQSAGRLARGSQLASRVYRSLPPEERVYAWFVELKSRAIGALKEGRREEDVLQLLHACLAVLCHGTQCALPERSTQEASQNRVTRTGTGLVINAHSSYWSHLFVAANGKLMCRQPVGVHGQVFASLPVLNPARLNVVRAGTKTLRHEGARRTITDYTDQSLITLIKNTTDYAD